jgi:hypothetical protein
MSHRVANRRQIISILLLGVVHATFASCAADGKEHSTKDMEDLLDRLLAVYRKYELPLPPDHAPLVKYAEAYAVDEDKKRHPLVSLGFLTKEARPGNHAEILIGTSRRLVWGNDQPKQVKPVPGVEAGIEIAGYGQFQTNACFATAIQCHARGWTELATKLFEMSMKEPFEHHVERDDYDLKATPITEVAFLAWAQRANELFRPETDRSVSLRRLKLLIVAEPRLDVQYNRDLIASLEAALVPSKGKPGSIDSMIDDLVELCPCDLNSDPRPQALALIERGFDAVPDLIAHLDDHRLTRFDSTGLGSHGFNYPFPVGSVCVMLLEGLVGYETRRTWDAEQPDDAAWKAKAQAWFEKAREKGEEQYLIENALPAGEWPNRYVLRVLSKKYPNDLVTLYRDLLEKRRGMQSWPMTDQIARSGLEHGQKLDLLRSGARHKSLEHCYAALGSLQELDPVTCVTLLVETLDQLPPTCQGMYPDCRESSFGLLVRGTADPRAWTALASAARRADVGLRLELLNEVIWQGTEGAIRTQQVAFLASFLTDETLRVMADNVAKFGSTCAAHRFPRIEVRNATAMWLASILGLKENPEPSWNAEQWADLRGQVLKAVGEWRP